MARDATVTVVGNLSRDPELRYGASGVAVCRFAVAVQETKLNRDTHKFEETGASFFDCTAFQQQAENIAASLQKGNRVIVTGSLKQDQWEDKDTGAKRSKVVIMVDGCGPDLRWAEATVVRNERSTVTAGSPRPASPPNPFGGDDESW